MTSHLKSHSSEYGTWAAMHQRCKNPNNRSFKDYGERGITVSDAWRSFSVFFDDMGPRPEGLTLERVDNDAGYSKENCVWASRFSQTQNRRNMTFIEFNGKRLTMTQWANEIGASKTTVWKRMKKGLPLDQVFKVTNSPMKGRRATQKY